MSHVSRPDVDGAIRRPTDSYGHEEHPFLLIVMVSVGPSCPRSLTMAGLHWNFRSFVRHVYSTPGRPPPPASSRPAAFSFDPHLGLLMATQLWIPVSGGGNQSFLAIRNRSLATPTKQFRPLYRALYFPLCVAAYSPWLHWPFCNSPPGSEQHSSISPRPPRRHHSSVHRIALISVSRKRT